MIFLVFFRRPFCYAKAISGAKKGNEDASVYSLGNSQGKPGKRTEKAEHNMATPPLSRNPGHEAFLVHLDSLRTAVTDPGGLATALYSQGLIDRLVYQRANLTTLTTLERSQELLSALDGKIATSKAAFDTFLSVMSRNPILEDLRALLSESRGIIIY